MATVNNTSVNNNETTNNNTNNIKINNTMAQLIEKLEASKAELAQCQDKPTNVLKAMKINIRKEEQKLEKALREMQLPTMSVVFWKEEESDDKAIMYVKDKQAIIFATTTYNMSVTKVTIEEGKELLNDELLENNPLYVVPAQFFYNNNIELKDLNGNIISKGTENVYVPTNNPNTYWIPQAYHNANIEAIIKGEPLKTIENVQIREFESVQEYGQYEGVNNVLSRGLNGTEKAGIATLATQNEFLKRVFEESQSRKMPISTTTKYFNEGRTIKMQVWNEAMLGNIPTDFKYDLSIGELILNTLDKMKFSDKVKKERYLIDAFSQLCKYNDLTKGEVGFDNALQALKALSETEVEFINKLTTDKQLTIQNMLHEMYIKKRDAKQTAA